MTMNGPGHTEASDSRTVQTQFLRLMLLLTVLHFRGKGTFHETPSVIESEFIPLNFEGRVPLTRQTLLCVLAC